MDDEMLPRVKFVVLSSGRAGSNMLCTMLNSHPTIRCHTEVFHPEAIFAIGYPECEPYLGTLVERDQDAKAFIRTIWTDHRGHTAVGFKLLNWQSRTAHLHVLLNRSVRKVVLYRKNRLATYVSLLRAQQTREYTSRVAADGKYDSTKVHVDLAGLQHYSRKNAAYLRLVRAVLMVTRQSCLQVFYGELNDDAEKRRILDYLGVEPNPDLIRPGTQRQSTTSLRDRIANIDELAEQIKGTRYEAELSR